MIFSVKAFLGAPIFLGNQQIDTTTMVFFSPETGKMTGIGTEKKYFFHFEDFIFEEKKIILQKEKQQNISGENWLSYHVKTTHGAEMGEVTDIEFDSEIGIVQRILATKSVFALPFSRHIFPYNRIVNIREKIILVDDDATEKEAKKEFCPA